jgi:hypothetical protein
MAAATADLDALARHLAADGATPSPRYPHTEWTPLLYAAGSPFHADTPDGAERFAEAARRLLDAGADANEHTLWTEEDGKSRLTALYGPLSATTCRWRDCFSNAAPIPTTGSRSTMAPS